MPEGAQPASQATHADTEVVQRLVVATRGDARARFRCAVEQAEGDEPDAVGQRQAEFGFAELHER